MYYISVIVPVFNVENYLEQCINSIINQTYKNIEVILVNDGSNDRSGSICDKYATKDTRIKVIHQVNAGLSNARNVGLDLAKGDFIGFVDSDDYIEEDMFEFLLKLALDNNADIAVCGTYSKNKINKTDNEKRNYVYLSEEAIKVMLTETKFNTSAWDKLYKKELFINIKYPKGKIYEDLDTTYKLIHKANKIVYNSTPKYYYRVNPKSITNRSFSNKNLDFLEISFDMINFLKKEYPSVTNVAYNRLVRYSISFLKTISDENFKDIDTINLLISIVRKNIFKYIFSNYKTSSKLYGLLLSINYNFASLVNKVYDKLNIN